MSGKILRGTILTFDAATWTASVLLHGSDAETIMYVGEWVPAALLDVADEVAVLLFGDHPTDTDDGLVLGPYGSVSTFNYPELSGLATGAVLRATSATTAAFGVIDLLDADAFDPTVVVTMGGINLGSAASAGTGGVRGSGNLKMAGTVIFGSASGTPARNVEINYAAPYLKFTGHATGDPFTIGVDGSGFIIFDDTAAGYRLRIANDGGVYLAGATGSSKGNGTLNLAGPLYNAGTQVVTARQTGYTNAWTGTLERAAARDASTVTLVQLAQRVAAIQADLVTHGLIGP